MAGNVFNILVYLFENLMLASQMDSKSDFTGVRTQLEGAGFKTTDILKALQWLADLKQYSSYLSSEISSSTFRIFGEDEQKKLSPSARHMLHCLERDQIITAAGREIIIDRAMALDFEEVHAGELNWILLFVLYIQGEQPIEIRRMENVILLDNATGTLH
ncbi:MAG: DUF494 domain-containing protein [Gammaproteobacteria bacterium]|nr:DUF494 domain-containing protein [Gammaproteobacteria bacterium]